MRRSRVGLAAIADWHNLAAAFWRAARGKGQRDDVSRFRADLNGELARLRESLLDGSVEVGRMRSFHIRDPKPRIIHAPCFRERVLHHAVMAHVGPVLDRALVDDTYACRVGKGALAAVLRAQHHQRRWPWTPRSTFGPTSPASTTQRCSPCWSAASRIGACWPCSRASSSPTTPRPAKACPSAP